MSLICVPIMVQDVAGALADAAAARDLSADLVEFRIDDLFTGAAGEAAERDIAEVLKLVRESPLPCIVTCRPAAGGEGGHYDGDDAARVSLFERLGTADGEQSPRYLDVELATYTRSENIKQKINLAVQHPAQVRDLRTSMILSSHDFDGRPADLLRRVATMQSQPGAAILKLAYRARSLRDNLELFDLLSERDRPMIALGMGEFGLMSRVLSPKFGGFLTFASLRATSTTAPGQPTVDELLNLYRFRSINAKTRVYGVVGYPVSHSLSPAVHNAGFEAIGKWPELDDRGNRVLGTEAGGVYFPMPIPAEYEHFKATLGAMLDHPRLDFAGCAVTIPHKEHLLRFAMEEIAGGNGESRDRDGRTWTIDYSARACGAANTLAVRRDADRAIVSCFVTNTDGRAALDALESRLGPVPGRSIAIIGAGGAARSIAHVLIEAGADVTIYNRTAERAERLAEELNASSANRTSAGTSSGKVSTAALDLLGEALHHAFINCTPIGMLGGPAPTESPIPVATLEQLATKSQSVIMDTVYNPLETPLLAAARRVGLVTIDGLEMFVRQGEAQFKIWTGNDAPLSLFSHIARETLARRSQP